MGEGLQRHPGAQRADPEGDPRGDRRGEAARGDALRQADRRLLRHLHGRVEAGGRGARAAHRAPAHRPGHHLAADRHRAGAAAPGRWARALRLRLGSGLQGRHPGHRHRGPGGARLARSRVLPERDAEDEGDPRRVPGLRGPGLRAPWRRAGRRGEEGRPGDGGRDQAGQGESRPGLAARSEQDLPPHRSQGPRPRGPRVRLGDVLPERGDVRGAGAQRHLSTVHRRGRATGAQLSPRRVPHLPRLAAGLGADPRPAQAVRRCVVRLQQQVPHRRQGGPAALEEVRGRHRLGPRRGAGGSLRRPDLRTGRQAGDQVDGE